MGKEQKEEKVETEKKLEQLKKEIAQKREEIRQLKKTMEEIRGQIDKKETTDKAELGKVFEDVSQLLDFGFNIFGLSGKGTDKESRGKGLLGLVNDLAALTEKSGEYRRRVKLGEKGVVDFSISTRPIRGSLAAKPKEHLRISKPMKERKSESVFAPQTEGPVKEREPIVDVFEEEDSIRVMAEIPGVEENKIDLSVDDNILTISADTPNRKYCKKVELPNRVRKDKVESSYKNGILEVRLSKVTDTEKTEKN